MGLKRDRGSNKSKGFCKLSIAGDMTIYSIESLKQELSGEIDIYSKFEIDLAGVEEFDSAGIQILLAFKKEIDEKKKFLTLTSVAEPVAKLMELYGVSDRFIKGGAA